MKNSPMMSGMLKSMRSMRSMRSMGALPVNLTPIPPEDREHLTSEQLNEIISRDLRVENPQAPRSLVRMNFNTNTFEEASNVEAAIVHRRDLGRIGTVAAIAATDIIQEENPEEEQQKEEKVLRNQFNFCDRATQGKRIRRADIGTITEAPQPKDCSGSTSQREIAEFYAKEKQIALIPSQPSPASITRVMERVVNQNLDPNISIDFKYYDDVRDVVNQKSGFTLPLWDFKNELVQGLNISLVEWNPAVNDLFAVGYGTSVTDRTGNYRGYIATWTLKNHSNPRNLIETEAPVSIIAWNQYQPSMIACGCANGNILVFDVRSRSSSPVLTTSKLTARHTLSVSYLKWLPQDSSGNYTLLSASLDGRILSWTLLQNEMKFTEINKLPSGIVGIDYFNEASTHYTVACDDGKIFKVLRTRTTIEPTSFEAHNPPVLCICQNKFHPEVYATSGADWSLKLWRTLQDYPLHIFDYAPNFINNVIWAPHSSTVFSVVSSDGVLRIYDLGVDRFKPISTTDVIEIHEGGLTSVAWHPKWPLIIIGDEKGTVHSLKISPNLRKNTKTAKEEEASRLANSTSGKRGINEPAQQDEDDDEGGKGGGEEQQAQLEAFIKDEAEKFEKCMGVSWLEIQTEVKAE